MLPAIKKVALIVSCGNGCQALNEGKLDKIAKAIRSELAHELLSVRLTMHQYKKRSQQSIGHLASSL